MRVILVGSPRDRARLRSQLDRTPIEIVGEVGSASDVPPGVDAIVMAGPGAEGGGPADPRDGDAAVAEPLTARETQVLGLMAEGLPNKAIAGALGISDQTVKFHVASITAKLGATNRTDAVRLALRRGLVTL
jgi:DNA-binding NarL/FixJ family response regulator